MPSGAYRSVNDTDYQVQDAHGEPVPVYIQHALIRKSMDMVDAVVGWIKIRIPELIREPSQIIVSFCLSQGKEIAWIDYQDVSLHSIDRDYIDWGTGLLVCKACLGSGRVRRRGVSRPPWSLCPDCSGRGRSLHRVLDLPAGPANPVTGAEPKIR